MKTPALQPNRAAQLFEKYANETGHFERVYHTSFKRDLHAMLVLSLIDPHAGLATTVISDATDEMITFHISTDAMCKASEENILTLIRCGVEYNREDDYFFMRFS